MNKVRPLLLLLVFAISLQVVWYAALMISYVRTPGKLEGADFLAFYSAGRVARYFGLSQVYNLDLEAVMQAETANVAVGTQFVLLPNHPPLLFPIIVLLARMPYRQAYLGYAVFLLILVIGGLSVLGHALQKSGWPRSHIWLALGGILLFEPLYISILKGQDSSVLLLGGLIWLSGLVKKDDRMAGLGLSLTLIRPQIALVLALPHLFKKQSIFGWFFIGAAALSIYSFMQVGWKGVLDFLQLVTISMGGKGYGMAESAMLNFTGVLVRFAPGMDIGLVHSFGWGLFFASIVGLCLLWGLSKTISFRHISIAVSLSLFAAPHLHYHDLALLIVPLVAIGIAGIASGRIPILAAASLPMMISIILLFSEIWDPLRFTVPYLLIAVFPIMTRRLEIPRAPLVQENP